MEKDETQSATKDESQPIPEEAKELRMSRGMKPELVIDFEKLKTLFVYDEMGNKIRFSDIYKKQKTIIILTRHLLDFITKEYVEDLALIPLEYLQEVDVRLVVVGPAHYKFIKDFKKLTRYQQTMYCDPDRQVYKTLGCIEKLACGPLSDSKHIKSGAWAGTLKSVWRAIQYQEFQGDVKQQGGAFILGPGEEVHFSHLDESSTDHTNINELLREAGVHPVNFPKDKPVIHI
ncbi:hypothetical protein C0Q70_16028 [Pomacea canaliculata]|uniref:Uncharacterized protein n=1 Tax=Pomacea canaliculata TaxID=400727 RepID=A0A2T7NNQ1_POMCA|nr:thioredoxin-like protein AAED1 [Pomacea canaliculata]PVD22772.1 hypothetical protein C0Q70_16028 [Pomacea canaliculata]